MRRSFFAIATYLVMLAAGVASGVYSPPILTAPRAPDTAALKSTVTENLYAGCSYAISEAATCLVGAKAKFGACPIGARKLGVSPLARTTGVPLLRNSPIRMRDIPGPRLKRSA
jgi:hypothetical protein